MWLIFYNKLESNIDNLILPNYLYGVLKILIKKRNSKISKSNSFIINNNELDDYAVNNDIESICDHSLFMEELVQFLDQFDEKCKNSFLKKWVNDMTYLQIAKENNESVECVKMRCNRIMKELRKIFIL